MLKLKGFKPDWTNESPPNGTYRSIFKWGAPDRFKHPNHRLYAMIKKEFQMTDADLKKSKTRGTNRLNWTGRPNWQINRSSDSSKLWAGKMFSENRAESRKRYRAFILLETPEEINQITSLRKLERNMA